MTREEAIKFASHAQSLTDLPEVKEFYALAESALREQEERRWIPVVERYPDTCGQYLCRAKNTIFEDSCYTEILRFERTGFYCRGIRINTVTHWIPLPEPPKEDGNDRS